MTLPSLSHPCPKNEKPGDRLPVPWLSHAHSAHAQATRRLRRSPKRVPPIPTRRLRDVEGHCSGRPDERDLRDARDDFTAPARPSSSLGPGSATSRPFRPNVLTRLSTVNAIPTLFLDITTPFPVRSVSLCGQCPKSPCSEDLRTKSQQFPGFCLRTWKDGLI